MTFDEVINHFGSQADVARALKCTKSYITKWLQEGYVPRVRQYEIEKITGGKLVVGKPFSVS